MDSRENLIERWIMQCPAFTFDDWEYALSRFVAWKEAEQKALKDMEAKK